MKKLGLVGVGAWGRRYIDSIARRTDCRIAAYVRASNQIDPSLAAAVRFDAWSALVGAAGRGELDGVIVAATPQVQADVAEAAMAAGVPALVEKPLGSSSLVVRRLLAEARQRASAPLLVNYIHLWAPAYQALRARVAAAGGASAVKGVASEGFNRGPFRGWSSLFDYGPHDLALCFDLLGVTAAFRLDEARHSVSGDVPGGELFSLRFFLDDSRVTMCVGNGASSKARRFAVTLRDGVELVYDDLQPHPYKLVVGGAPVPIAQTSPLDAVLTTFVDRLGQRAAANAEADQWASIPTLELTLRVQETLEMIAAAAAPP